MLVPDIAYRFVAPTDTAGPSFEILSRQQSLSGGPILTVLTVSDIPKDRILVLSNVELIGEPGATQNVEEMKIQGVTQAGLIFDIDADVRSGSADDSRDIGWHGQVWIQGGGDGNDTVRTTVLFNSVTNANTVTVGIHGIIVPHGNAGAF